MLLVLFAFKPTFTQMYFRRELCVSTENRKTLLYAKNKCNHKYEFHENKATPLNSVQMQLKELSEREKGPQAQGCSNLSFSTH